MNISDKNEGVDFSLRVQPNAKKEEIGGVAEGALKIRVTSSPKEGEANEACVRFLARILDVPKSRISILAGARSRTKRIRVAGMTRDELQFILKPYLREP